MSSLVESSIKEAHVIACASNHNRNSIYILECVSLAVVDVPHHVSYSGELKGCLPADCFCCNIRIFLYHKSFVLCFSILRYNSLEVKLHTLATAVAVRITTLYPESNR